MIISSNPAYLYQKGLSEFQLKFYYKMYRVRMVEQNRFDKNAAWLAQEFQRFHQLQGTKLNKAAVKCVKIVLTAALMFDIIRTKAAVNGRKKMFTASLRGEICDWTRTGNKRIK